MVVTITFPSTKVGKMALRRDAFTMIELIFVIVVIGILASVAMPKFLGVREQAEDNIIKSFASTMTRTVGHTLWSKSLVDGQYGTIRYGTESDKFAGRLLSFYVDIPTELDSTTVNFDNCVRYSGTAQPFIQHSDGFEYNVFCRDGNATDAPEFVADKSSSYVF